MLQKIGNWLLKKCSVTDKMFEKSKSYSKSRQTLPGSNCSPKQIYPVGTYCIDLDSLSRFWGSIEDDFFGENKILEAGDVGEESLKRIVLTHKNFLNSQLWASKRVKLFRGDRGPNEIDIVLITDNRIYLFECKNISGNLSVNTDKTSGKAWCISKQKYINGERTDDIVTREWDDQVSLLKIKSKKLYDYILSKDIPFQESLIESKVIFINKNLTLSKDIESSPHVVSYEKLTHYFDNITGEKISSKDILSALVKYCMALDRDFHNSLTTPISYNRSIVANLIERLPTWDSISAFEQLRNPTSAQIRKGDIISLRRIFIDFDEIALSSAQRLVVRCPRSDDDASSVVGDDFVKIYLYSKDGSLIKILRGNPDPSTSYVRFQPAGNPNIKNISCYLIDELYLNGFYRPEEDV